MAVGSRPFSNTPEAIRKRRQREQDQLAAKVAELAGRITPAGGASSPSSPAPANDNTLPLHTSQPMQGPGADTFGAVPELAPREAGGAATPLVPEQPAGELGADGQPAAAAAPGITPEEAKEFATLVVMYFQFGSGQLFRKHPEFVEGLLAMAGGDPKQFEKGFATANKIIFGASERVALKYNLRIPYMDEAIVLGAIGVATFGLAGKPSKRGADALKEEERVANAKNGNPSKSAGAAPSEGETKADGAAPTKRDEGPLAEKTL